MLIFSSPHARSIEAALAAARPGRWRRAKDAELSDVSRLGLHSAWRVDLPKSLHQHPTVDSVLVGIDAAFPWSEPRVVARQAGVRDAMPWPHVEPKGILCLRTTRFDADAGARVLTTLQDAIELFLYSEEDRTLEFQREFVSYWTQHATEKAPDTISLVSPDGTDRDIVYWRHASGSVVFADDPPTLSDWLHHSGQKPPASYPSTRLTWLSPSPMPDAYPRVGEDILALVGRAQLQGHLVLGVALPVLLGLTTPSGRVFAAAEIHGARSKIAAKGFRKSSKFPQRWVPDYFRVLPISRCRVDRVDAAWVHGRDHNPDLVSLRGKTVGLVGCGALGGYVARNLIQAGVGRLLLIDNDSMSAPNTTRHVLGMGARDRRKANALAEALARDFPQTLDLRPLPVAIEHLDAAALEALAKVDLLISAGITLSGDVTIQEWRDTLGQPPPWLCTWTEEFALAGHAVALFGPNRLMDGFDGSGHYRGRLTSNWPKGVATIAEAGCGNSFQPYGAVDLQGTVTMASRLAMDMLMNRTKASCTRQWLGDRSQAVSRRCTVSPSFDQSFCERVGAWPL